MPSLLVSAFYALAVVMLAWDVMVLGRSAQTRRLSPTFRGTCALGALLVLAALLVQVASSTIATGRAVHSVQWLWPATVALFTIQALYALVKRLASPLIAVPIALYDLLLFASATARYLEFKGATLGVGALAISAADANALGLILRGEALSSPLALLVPLAVPGYPARWRVSTVVRGFFATVAMVWLVLLLVQLPPSVAAIASYERYTGERLQERPAGDFKVGVRLLPTLRGRPPALAVRNDLALHQTIDGDAVHVVYKPEGARALPLDSLAVVLDALRRDTVLLIVSLDYPENARTMMATDPERYVRNRMIELDRIARRLRPDYLIPAREPYTRGTQAMGEQPFEFWRDFHIRAANVIHRAYPAIKVGVSIAGFTPPDSALYAWAASRDAPVNAVGFTFFPSFAGARALEARLSTVDRWLRTGPASRKELWVWHTGGYPMAHGDESQERAIWRVLAWATSRPQLRGVIVGDAGDYSGETGLRAPGGRLRPAVQMIARAIRGLRENREVE